MTNRKTNSRKLYENYLAGKKCEFVVSLDEAYVYLSNCNHNRRICHVSKGKEFPTDWVCEKSGNFDKGL
jgi:hypothetical protein